jgi:hypothetical protein
MSYQKFVKIGVWAGLAIGFFLLNLSIYSVLASSKNGARPAGQPTAQAQPCCRSWGSIPTSLAPTKSARHPRRQVQESTGSIPYPPPYPAPVTAEPYPGPPTPYPTLTAEQLCWSSGGFWINGQCQYIPPTDAPLPTPGG